MATQLDRPSRVERSSIKETGQKNNKTKKRISLNFICMIMVSGALDTAGIFVNAIPGVGIMISFISNIIFIPWFYFSGISFTSKRIASMGTSSILEYIPIIGNLPMITTNVIYSYYSE